MNKIQLSVCYYYIILGCGFTSLLKASENSVVPVLKVQLNIFMLFFVPLVYLHAGIAYTLKFPGDLSRYYFVLDYILKCKQHGYLTMMHPHSLLNLNFQLGKVNTLERTHGQSVSAMHVYLCSLS